MDALAAANQAASALISALSGLTSALNTLLSTVVNLVNLLTGATTQTNTALNQLQTFSNRLDAVTAAMARYTASAGVSADMPTSVLTASTITAARQIRNTAPQMRQANMANRAMPSLLQMQQNYEQLVYTMTSQNAAQKEMAVTAQGEIQAAVEAMMA